MTEENQQFTPYWDIEDLRQEMYALYPVTREFLLACINAGVLETVQGNKIDTWERELSIALEYFLGEETQKEVADRWNMSKYNISDLLSRVVDRLWKNAPESMQQEYPDKIRTKKKMRLVSAHQYMRGDLQLDARRNDGRISQYRQTLFKETGQVLPGISNQKTDLEIRLFTENLTKPNDDETVQGLLDQVTMSYYKVDQRRAHQVLTPVKKIAPELTHHWHGVIDLVNVLRAKANHIPVGEFEHTISSGKYKGNISRYYFILARHRERAVSALMSAKELEGYKKSSVQQIAGPAVEIPIPRKLRYKIGYENVSRLLRKYGIHTNAGMGTIFTIKDFFEPDKCPVPIFCYLEDKYYFPIDRIGELAEYIQVRRHTIENDPNVLHERKK